MNKKWMASFLIATTLIAGCTQEESKKNEKKKVVDNDFTIVMEKEDKVDLADVETLIEEKYGKNVDIKIVSSDEKREMLIKGEADVALLTQEEIGFAKDEELIQEVEFDKSKYIKSTVTALQYEGKQYAIPGNFNVPFLIVNGDIIKKIPLTFEEFKQYQENNVIDVEEGEEEAKEKNKQQDEGQKKVEILPPYVTYLNLNEYETIDNVLHAFGYIPFSKKDAIYQTDKVNITSDVAKKGFEQIKQWTDTMITIEDLNNKNIKELFNEGRLYSFVGYKEQLEDLKGNISMIVIPNITENVSFKPTIQVKGWAVSTSVENKEIIRDFEKIISEEEFVRKQIDERSIFAPIQLKEEENILIKVMYEQAENSYSLPIIAEARELKTPIKNALEWYLTEKVDLDTALKNAKQTIEFEIMSNY